MAATTDAVAAYRADFDRFAREREDAPWLRGLREAAISRFGQVGFPTLKDEAWKYTSVAPIARTTFHRGKANGVAVESLESVGFPGYQGIQVVFVNGHFSRQLSSLGSLPPGVRIESLANVLAADSRLVEGRLGRYASIERDAFAALNAAFFEDGAFVHIPRGTVAEAPIHLLFVSRPGEGPTVSHPRSLVVLEEGSQATIIESYAGWSPDVYLTNAVTEIAVGPNAVLDHYKVQRESEKAYHVGTVQVLQERASNVADLVVSLGGGLARNNVNAWFNEEGSELALNGLYVVGGAQHVDNHTIIDHAKPHCTSLELYKGILDGRARGVFYGNITVHPDAQKTNAMQTNKNLLLSNEALVDSIPGLRILANDVKCRHGSTIGHLEEDQVFYLRSRGLDELTARSLLTYGFARELVDRIKVKPMRMALNEWVLSRLPNSELVRQAL